MTNKNTKSTQGEQKKRVFLAGASGTMGWEAFKELWSRRDSKGNRKYDIVLLQRPSKKNKKLFCPYEKQAGIQSISGAGVVEGDGLKIVWGDATFKEDVFEACKGVDWVLNALAMIPPLTDFKPDLAMKVNYGFVKHVIDAINEQPYGPESIKLVQVGSISQTGDRLAPIHHMRMGDPVKACVFDNYTVTKNAAGRLVCESNLHYWVNLRVTFIMATDVLDMQGPYMFYQPLAAFMENITARDSGLGLVNCLDVPDNSDFWRRCYTMSGGPSCRINFLETLKRSFGALGMDYRNILDRNWFALKNYHMHYFDDSHVLSNYLHYWRDSMEDYFQDFKENLPTSLKVVAWLNKHFSPFRYLVEKATRARLKNFAEDEPAGTVYWYQTRNDLRIKAFFGSYEDYENIPGWGVDEPKVEPELKWDNIDHGYDDSKDGLELSDLKNAAEFRGGQCLEENWNGDEYSPVKWKCAFGHKFELKPYTALRAGYWCPDCAPAPWNYDKIAEKNPFFAQVWYPMHEEEEDNFYPKELVYEFQEHLKKLK